MQNKVHYRVSTGAALLLIGFAVICDLIGLIPIAKDITLVICWIVTNLYLVRKGIGFKDSSKRIAAEVISIILSAIPIIQEIPVELSLGVFAVILTTRIEDKVKHRLNAGSDQMPLFLGKSVASPLNKGGVRSPVNQRTALYLKGIRAPNRGVPQANAEPPTAISTAHQAPNQDLPLAA